MQPAARTMSAGWTYSATASTVLKTTTLALALGETGAVKFAQGRDIKPKHSAAYWAKVTAGFDFSDADRVLWQGLMGRKPYPVLLQGQTAERMDD
jgi:gluconate kinase